MKISTVYRQGLCRLLTSASLFFLMTSAQATQSMGATDPAEQQVSFDFENGVSGWESGPDQTPHESPSPLPVICCANGFHGNNCRSAIDIIELSLRQLKARLD